MKSIRLFAALLPLLLIYVNKIQAQVFAEDMKGNAIRETKYTNINGSPYWDNTWQRGTVKFANGQVIKNMLLKYDQVDDMLLFKNAKGDSLRFVLPVTEFTLPAQKEGETALPVFRNQFPAVDGNNTNNYYEVLYDGKTKFLKRTKKTLVTQPSQYSSAVKQKDIVQRIDYFISKSGLLVAVKLDKKSFLKVLNDKSSSIDEYAGKNNLNFKKESDCRKIAAFYDSL